MTAERDPIPLIAGIAMILVAVAIGVYALFWPSESPPATNARNVEDLERALADAKRACVAGPPQNASCAEATRLTTQIAKARAIR